MSSLRPIHFDRTAFGGLDRMSQHLAFHTRRQQVIAANLANIDTPGYRPKDLAFSEVVSIAVDGNKLKTTVTHGEEVLVQDDETPDQDGNSVSLEKQMAKLTANQLRYQSLTELLSRKIGLLRYAASDGR